MKEIFNTNQIKIPPNGMTDLFTRMGRALFYCQTFEETLAYSLCILLDITRFQAEDLAYDYLNKQLKKTLGQLLNEFPSKSCKYLNKDTETRLKEFKDERNWLAHRIAQENPGLIFHSSQLKDIFLKLENLKIEAQSLVKLFESFVYKWFEESGYSKAELQEKMEEIFKGWKK